MSGRVARLWWAAGWPVRFVLIGAIRAYRITLGALLGGRCRFYPSCSAYAEQAIRECGALRGIALTVWRILRCSPLSRGGVDHPPKGHGSYESVIHGRHVERRREVGAAA